MTRLRASVEVEGRDEEARKEKGLLFDLFRGREAVKQSPAACSR